jgi:hypothetical protein
MTNDNDQFPQDALLKVIIAAISLLFLWMIVYALINGAK